MLKLFKCIKEREKETTIKLCTKFVVDNLFWQQSCHSFQMSNVHQMKHNFNECNTYRGEKVDWFGGHKTENKIIFTSLQNKQTRKSASKQTNKWISGNNKEKKKKIEKIDVKPALL